MARNIPAPVLELLDQGRIIMAGAHRIESTVPMMVWSGHWTLDIDGDDYMPLGADTLVTSFQYEVGQAANGVEITLSGVDTNLVPTVLSQDLRGLECTIYRLFFDEHGTTLLHVEPYFYGTVDQILARDTPGGSAQVVFRLEGEAQGSQRSGGRLAADQDQRLVNADDGSLRYVSTAPEITLYWGGSGPKRAKAALGT